MKTKCCHSNHAHRSGNGIICINQSCENYLGHTTLVHDFHQWKNPVAACFFIFYLFFSLADFSMENNEPAAYCVPASFFDHKPLTIQNLEQELKEQQILCPREVLAQIKIESAHLNSFLLKRANNMLGMRYPFSRETKACGLFLPKTDSIIYGTKEELKKYRKSENYAVYASWQDAVADYKLWQENCFNISERYLEFLGNVYAEDSMYVNKIKQVAGK